MAYGSSALKYQVTSASKSRKPKTGSHGLNYKEDLDSHRGGRKISSSSVTTTYDKGTGDVTRTHRSTNASPHRPDLTLVEKRYAPKGSVASKDVTKIPAGRITSGSTSRFGSSSLIVGKGKDSYVSDKGVSRYDPYKEKHIKKQSPNESKMTSFSAPKSKVVPKLFSALNRAMKKRMIKQRDQMRKGKALSGVIKGLESRNKQTNTYSMGF